MSSDSRTHPRRSTIVRWMDRERVFKWLPFIPVQLLLVLLLLPNFLLLVYLSLLPWRITRGAWWDAPFVGTETLLAAFHDDRFVWAIIRTFTFAAIAVPVELFLGFGLALLCRGSFRGRRAYCALFIVPMMIVPAVVGYNLSIILIDQGPLNEALSLFTGQTVIVRWLSDYTAAQIAVICADVWQWTSLMFLIILSGLAGLPPDPLRAARVMGATRWQIFRHIELPLLKPVIAIALILRSMEALKIFDNPMLLTQGGPGNATETIAIYLWRVGWEFARVSDAAAMSLILFVIVAIYTLFVIRVLRRERGKLAAESTR